MSDTLKDAYASFNKKNYSEVIRILEAQVFRFRDNFNFFYMLGMSCLYQGDFGGAFSYLRRAIDLREDDINSLLGIAAIYLKRGDTGNALKIWLDIIEIDPTNVQAQRGLNYLKKSSEPDEFTSLGTQDKISRFLPQGEKKRKNPVMFLIPIFIATTITLVFLFPTTRNFILSAININGILFENNNSKRTEIPDVTLDERKDYIDLSGDYSFILTEDEVEQKLKDIQDYLYDFRDNIAQKEINMIILSNASEYVKDRARLLAAYVQPQKLPTFKDNFTYSDVTSFPLLYEGCYILWKGKTTNIEESTEKIGFDFLVGYHEEKTLEGIVPVIFNFAIRIVPDEPIELLGKVFIDDSGRVSIQGISIHHLQ